MPRRTIITRQSARASAEAAPSLSRRRIGSPRCGVTLMELLVTIGIMGLLLTIGVGFYWRMSRGFALRAAVSSIESALRGARAFAIHERSHTVVALEPLPADPTQPFLIESLSALGKRTVSCWHFESEQLNDSKTKFKGALGQEGDPMLAYAADLAELGFVTLSPDHFCAGERTPPEGAYVTHRFYQRFPEWSAVGKNLWETRIAIDVLGSLEQVDGGRIGCMGHSLGGSGTVFTAAFDERVTCAVCNCGLNNFRCNPMRIKWARDGWYIYLPSLRPLFLAEEPPPFDWHELAACIAPRAFLDVSALHDRCLEGSQHVPGMLMRVQEVYDLHEAGERCASFFHNAGHGMSRATRAAAYAWLEQWLAAGYA